MRSWVLIVLASSEKQAHIKGAEKLPGQKVMAMNLRASASYIRLHMSLIV